MSERVADLYKESDFEVLLESARMNADSEWEETFVRSLKSKHDLYGNRMYLSESQKSNLERIASED